MCVYRQEKAYDTVNRKILWGILKKIGVTKEIIELIQSLYRDTNPEYDLEGKKVKDVKGNRGLRQGCTLSPLIFTIYIEEMAYRIKR